MIPAVRLTAPPIEAVVQADALAAKAQARGPVGPVRHGPLRFTRSEPKIGRRALTACRARSTFDRDRDRISQEISHLSLTTFRRPLAGTTASGSGTQRHTPRLHRRRGRTSRPKRRLHWRTRSRMDFDSDANVLGRHALGRAPLNSPFSPLKYPCGNTRAGPVVRDRKET